jgi:PAS domain S-box-containing protein
LAFQGYPLDAVTADPRTRSPEADRILQHAVDEAARLLRVDGAFIDLLDPVSNELHWAYEAGDGSSADLDFLRAVRLPVGQGIFGQAVGSRHVLVTGDYLADQRFPHAPGPDEFARRIGLNSVVAAPIPGPEGPIGALGLYARPLDAFDDAAVGLVAALADHAGAALQNAMLIGRLQRSQEELARRAERERALRELAASINAIQDPSELLQRVVAESGRLVGSDGAIIYLLEEGTDRLRWAFDAGITSAAERKWIRNLSMPIGQGLFGRAVAEREIVCTDDYVGDQDFTHTPEADRVVDEVGIRAMAVAPLVAGDRALGGLGVYSHRPAAFSDADRALVQALADQAATALANARLIQELARSRAEVAARADSERTLREIAARITAIRSPAEVLQRVVDDAVRLLGAGGGRIDLIDESEGALNWAYGHTSADHEIELTDEEEEQISLDEGVAGLAIVQRRVVRSGDYLNDTSFLHKPWSDRYVQEQGIHSVMSGPLIGDSGAMGTLTVHSTKRDAFTEDDASLLGALASQAAIAVTNAKLIQRLERSQRDLGRLVESERSLREITARITSISDRAGVLQLVVDESRRLLGSDGSHLTLMAPDGQDLIPEVVAGHADDETREWLRGQRFPIGGGINGLAAQAREAVWTDDYLVDPRIPHEEDDQQVAGRLGLRAMAAAPLYGHEREVIGTLAISYTSPRAFTADAIGLLQGLADQAAIAVTNARLYDRMAASERRYRHLVENSPDLVWSADPEGNFTFLSEQCLPLTGYRPDELMGRHFSLLMFPGSGDGIAERWALLAREPDTQVRVRFYLRQRDAVPRAIEVIAVGEYRDGTFVGAHGAVRDLSESDQLEREMRQQAGALAAAEERAHLARELHDSVTQALFSMTLTTRSVELLMDRDLDAAKSKLSELRELQRDALAEMRGLLFEMRPGSLEQDGLVQALRTHAAAVQGRTGLPVVLDARAPERLPLVLEDALFRIAQEALHNVVKHASASSARIELTANPHSVQLVIEDDGQGFDENVVGGGRLGLAGMRTRTERIGGAFNVSSRPGNGTRVEIVAPVTPESDAAAPVAGGMGATAGA